MLLLSIPFWAVLYGFAAIGLICFAIVNGRQSRIENLVRRSEKGILEPDPHEDSYNLDHPIFKQNEIA